MTRSLVASLLVLAACGPAPMTADGGSGHAHTDVTQLTFKARVGTQDFACGQTYTLGTPPTQYRPRDFRLYVHDVVLTTEEGVDVPFTLTDDGAFQKAGVALLDFENRAGECSAGTEATNTVLRGLAAGGHYEKLSFTVGVPFAQNHQDAAAAAAPLNSTAMFWNWNGGYKFVKIDGLTTGLPMGHNLHLGSTGCMAGAAPNSVASCTNANRPRVTLTFNPELGAAVVLDLARLFEGSNLDTNTAMTAPGCMSGATDPECAPIFQKFGLPFGPQPAGTQSVFSVE
ncbi:MAG: metallo-mystery pair system four-Cys motif protein [Myxococcaceae bacterium]|nr:metallo-mystery pair system four-Cys motif protein [Myxococcaceae bacterium]